MKTNVKRIWEKHLANHNQNQKQNQKSPPKPEPEPKVKINKKKVEEIEKDFYELRHRFSKNELKDYRKAFYITKNYKHLSETKRKKRKELLSEWEIEKTNKNLNKLKKFKV